MNQSLEIMDLITRRISKLFSKLHLIKSNSILNQLRILKLNTMPQYNLVGEIINQKNQLLHYFKILI